MKDETWDYTPAAFPAPDAGEGSELSEPCGTAVRQDERIAKVWVPQEIPPAPPVAPTPAEKRQIRKAEKQVGAKMPAPEVRIGQDAHGHPVVGLPHTDEAGWQAQTKAAFGTASGAFVDAEILRLLAALRATRDDLPLETKVNAALAVIAGIAPRNEVEALLAVQMAMTHVAAMRMLGELNRLNPHVSPGGVAISGTIGAKLLRAFAGQAEALAKLRRPAEQVVRVERVNVAAGGQAIVGAVTHPRHGASPKIRINPMERNTRESPSLRLTPRCGAKRRNGLPCQKPRAKDRSRCRLHGGAPGSGAPGGKADGRYSHGLLTAEAMEERTVLSEILEGVSSEGETLLRSQNKFLRRP